MKCPKCGFNSFEYYDNCKKCSADLTAYKVNYLIASLILPLEAREKLAANYLEPETAKVDICDVPETHDDIFAFDLPDDTPPPLPQNNDDPFNFDEPPADTEPVDSLKSDEDIFANFLESTSQVEAPAAFVESKTETTDKSPEVKEAVTDSSLGEFDLESFSWEESPADPATTDTTDTTDTTAVADDLASIFGDTKEETSK